MSMDLCQTAAAILSPETKKALLCQREKMRVAKGFSLTRDITKIISVMRDWTQVKRGMRDWTWQRDA